MASGMIQWPADPKAAVAQYLKFQMIALRELGIILPVSPNDPISTVERWINSLFSDTDLDAARDAWWSIIDTPKAITDMQSRAALQARLALCLLSVREKDAPVLADHLSWFLEVLGFYGADMGRATELVKSYFGLAKQ